MRRARGVGGSSGSRPESVFIGDLQGDRARSLGGRAPQAVRYVAPSVAGGAYRRIAVGRAMTTTETCSMNARGTDSAGRIAAETSQLAARNRPAIQPCLLYTSDAADERSSVD